MTSPRLSPKRPEEKVSASSSEGASRGRAASDSTSVEEASRVRTHSDPLNTSTVNAIPAPATLTSEANPDADAELARRINAAAALVGGEVTELPQGESASPAADKPKHVSFADSETSSEHGSVGRQEGLDMRTPWPVAWQTHFKTLGRYTFDGVNAAAVVTVMAADGVLPCELPTGPVVNCLTVVAAFQASRTLRRLASNPHPLDYFRNNGVLDKRMVGREAGCFAAGAVVAGLSGLGVGYIMEAVINPMAVLDEELSSSSMENTMLPGVVCAPICAGVALTAYGSTRLLLNRFVYHSPAYDDEVNDDIHRVQRFAARALRTISPVLLFEILRQGLLTAGEEAALHHQDLMLLIIGFDQVMNSARYMLFVPRPIARLLPEPRLNLNGEEIVLQGPTAQDKAKLAGWYSLRLGVVLGLGWVMNAGLNAISQNKENLSTSEALGCGALLVVGSQLIEQAVEVAPAAYTQFRTGLANCHARLFGARRAPEQQGLLAAQEEARQAYGAANN